MTPDEQREHERQSMAGTHAFDTACYWCLLDNYEHPVRVGPDEGLRAALRFIADHADEWSGSRAAQEARAALEGSAE